MDVKYQHISSRYETKFSYKTIGDKNITLDQSIMKLQVVEGGLFFGMKGIVEGGESREIAKIP